MQAAANRLQIYKTLFIYFCLVYKDAVKLKKPLFGMQRRSQIKKPLGGEGSPIYGYVVLDVYPFTNESTRIRSSIFTEEHDPVTVYTDNKTQ